MSSALIRLGRLMELQGIAPSRAGAATGSVSKRKSKGATGGGGAATAATEAGTSPEDFGTRRQGGATVIRIEADDLGDVFDQGAVGTQGGFITRFSSGGVRRELAQVVQPGRPPRHAPRANGGSSGSFLMRFSGPSAPGGSCALFPLLPLAPIVGLIESWCF